MKCMDLDVRGVHRKTNKICFYCFQVAASPPMPLGAPVMSSMMGAPVIANPALAAMSRLPVAAPPPPASVAGFGMPPGGIPQPMMRQPYAAAGKEDAPATRTPRCPNLSRRKPPWISRALEVYGRPTTFMRKRERLCGASEKDPFQISLCTYFASVCRYQSCTTPSKYSA